MNNLVIILLCSVLAFQVSGHVPRDLTDEAAEQLANLESIVQAQIAWGHNLLEDFLLSFVTHSENILQNGKISIDQKHQTVIGQIATLEDLAMSAGKDVTVCTDIREQVLDRLPTEYKEQMEICIGNVNNEAAQIVSDASYVVDVHINKVHDLQFQLSRCQGEILCITTIVSQIELYMVSLPKAIHNEVNSSEGLLEMLTLSSQACSSQKIAEYTAGANAALEEIEACINEILESV